MCLLNENHYFGCLLIRLEHRRMPMLTRRIPSQSSQGLSETRKLNGYFQEVFETYEEWMPMATIHAHVLDYMKEDSVSAEF